nr:hypothetical protein [Tanacetum cinerariifolium]
MANLPSPDQAVDFSYDEPVKPEPALVIHHHAPTLPEGYINDDDMEDDEEDPNEDPKEEPNEQVIPEQNNMDGFALHINPQPAGNMNGWLIEDDDEEVEEDGVDNVDDEEIEVDEEDKDDGVDDNEDEAEVINAYEEVDPLNQPPPTSDEETEFAPPVVLIADVNNEPIPPVIQFSHNFYVGEGSSVGALLAGNNKVNSPGLIACKLESVRRVAARLDKQMFDRTMPPRRRSQTNPQPPLTQEAFNQLVRDRIKTTIRAKRERVREEATRAEGAVGLCRWFKRTKSTFGIRLEVANGKPWVGVKKMMIDEFCPIEEVQRLEDELRHLKLRDKNIAAYTVRFNELALFCPNVVPNEKKKVELYIKGFLEVIKGETASSRPAMLNDVVRMAHTLMEQKIQAKNKRVAQDNKRRWENNN